jgi:hypothetical protein
MSRFCCGCVGVRLRAWDFDIPVSVKISAHRRGIILVGISKLDAPAAHLDLAIP